MKFQISLSSQLGPRSLEGGTSFLRSLPSLQEINIGSEARFERREIQGAAFWLLSKKHFNETETETEHRVELICCLLMALG